MKLLQKLEISQILVSAKLEVLSDFEKREQDFPP